LLSACGSLPREVARAPSQALAPSPESALVRTAQASVPSPDVSGFRLMPLGAFSLDTRLQLAQRAQRSLDVQYYVLENDPTGRLLIQRLHAAAARGVRVRLLVDDLYTGNSHELLRSLAAFPNVQVRLFNPFCCWRQRGPIGRFAGSIFDVKRLNHRMHNKLFIADNAMAVAGGRNIADEYFMRSTAQNFVDMDAFMVGGVVADLSKIFDSYWNSEVVYPIEAIDRSGLSAEQLQEVYGRLMALTPIADLPDPDPVDALGYGPLREELDGERIGLVWGKSRAYADPPEKLLSETRAAAVATSLTRDALMTLWMAQSELVVTSPYLIPGKSGMKEIEQLRARGVKITILTNSLAATDEPLVHTGYSRYRFEMLQHGVDLYELSPLRTRNSMRLGMFGSSLGRLHAKTAVMDRKLVFIGSMNLDPRSESQNTELGIFIESPSLAKELLRIVNISKLESAYKVRLSKDGQRIEWLTTDEDKEAVLYNEPESTFLLRLHNLLLAPFVPEQLL